MNKILWVGGLLLFLVWVLQSRASSSEQKVNPSPPLIPITPEQLAEVETLARAGNKISAIKLYRKLTGIGLKDAKDAVEHLIT